MKMELGAQTFTVRDYMQTTWDFREAMKRIAEIGYTCVQLSAVGNVPVQAQRDICDEFGLKIVLTHTNPDRMIADPEGVIRDHDILGCDYIGIGMMNPKYQRAEWIDQFAKDFTTPAKKMRDAGKLLMYHNHNLEWTRLRDGRRIMDVLLEQMPADLMGVTLDTYWVQAGGGDPAYWLRRLSGRVDCVHFKDMVFSPEDKAVRMAAIGDGNMNYPEILRACEDAGVQYAFVEQDNCYGVDPFLCLKRSYDWLHAQGLE